MSLEHNGGCYHPTPGNSWTAYTYDVVLGVPEGSYALEDAGHEVIWAAMQAVLRQLWNDGEIDGLLVKELPPVIEELDPDWRKSILRARPTNQARKARERSAIDGTKPIMRDQLFFDSNSEVMIYNMLKKIQRELDGAETIAIVPLPGVAVRDLNYTITPDFLVIGMGKAAIVETDGPHHRKSQAVVDDLNRNRVWERCGMPPAAVRVAVKDLDRDPAEVERTLREDLVNRLGLPASVRVPGPRQPTRVLQQN